MKPVCLKDDLEWANECSPAQIFKSFIRGRHNAIATGTYGFMPGTKEYDDFMNENSVDIINNNEVKIQIFPGQYKNYLDIKVSKIHIRNLMEKR